MKRRNCVSGILAFCIFIALPLFCVAHCMLKKQPPPSPAEIAAKQLNSDIIDARTWAKILVENSLKAPKTAVFQNVLDFAVAQAKDKKGNALKDVWEVSGDVDAQNSFGAILRNRFYIKMKKDGDKWIPLNIQLGT